MDNLKKIMVQNFELHSVGNEEPMIVLLAYVLPIFQIFLEPECYFVTSWSPFLAAPAFSNF